MVLVRSNFMLAWHKPEPVILEEGTSIEKKKPPWDLAARKPVGPFPH